VIGKIAPSKKNNKIKKMKIKKQINYLPLIAPPIIIIVGTLIAVLIINHNNQSTPPQPLESIKYEQLYYIDKNTETDNMDDVEVVTKTTDERVDEINIILESKNKYYDIVELETLRPVKIDGTQEQQEIIDYAWSLSNDQDWILTLETENGHWTVDRIGGLNNGYIGLCQLSRYYHKAFIESPEFLDYKHQLLYCVEVYARAMDEGRIHSTFQGYTDRWKAINNFTWRNNE